MNIHHRGLWLSGLFLSFVLPNSAQASWTCDWFGVSCPTVTLPGGGEGELKTTVDQNNPPEVFAFTVRGDFQEWADIPERTFVCDTRQREDRACIWQHYIPEIGDRHMQATIVFMPFAHDRGMYQVEAGILSPFGSHQTYSLMFGLRAGGKDKNGKDKINWIGDGDGVSIATLASTPLVAELYKRDWEGGSLKLQTLGTISLDFKGALK